MIKKILITGAQGLVGSRFVELYKDKYHLYTPSIDEFNLLDINLMKKYIEKRKLDAIINFAAFTDVGEAENERGKKSELCWKVNVEGVTNLSNLALHSSLYFVQISTDMVFSGSENDPGPYDETHEFVDNPDKLSWYGYTKGIGEQAVKNSVKNYSILRIIYPVRANYDLKSDYLRKPLRLYSEGNLYPLFNDQRVSITFIDEACNVIYKILEQQTKGILHCSSTDITTPYELINYLIEAKYGVKNAVKPTSIYEFYKIADKTSRYPIFGGLNTRLTSETININFSTWKEIVDILIQQGISA